jgi:hypothetical protein
MSATCYPLAKIDVVVMMMMMMTMLLLLYKFKAG